MKITFETKKLSDKVLVTMFDNGQKVSSVWKMNESSNYVNMKDLQDQMELNYIMDNLPDDEEEEA